MGTILAIIFLIIGLIIYRKFFIEAVKLIKRLLAKLTGSEFKFTNKKTVYFLEYELVNNKEFKEEFKNLIASKGGLNDFIRHTSFPIQEEVDYDGLGNTVMWHGYKEHAIDSNNGLQLNKNAVNITDKILSFNSFILLAKMNELDEKDIQYIGNCIFLLITDDFRKFAEKYLY